MSLNKYGKCPNCNIDWDKGDMKQVLGNVNMFAHKTDYEISKIVTNYGYTEFNKGNFSSLTIVNTEDNKKIAKCSNMRCGHCFNLETGDEYSNLKDACNNVDKIERT